MLGLSVEKLIVIGVIAALVIGPQRLPLYAEKLAAFIRGVRAFTESTRTRAERDLGVPLNTAEWNAQLRQYDPRRIVRDALREDAAPDVAEPAPLTRVRWEIVGGSSGHPVRRRVVEEIAEEIPEEIPEDVPDDRT